MIFYVSISNEISNHGVFWICSIFQMNRNKVTSSRDPSLPLRMTSQGCSGWQAGTRTRILFPPCPFYDTVRSVIVTSSPFFIPKLEAEMSDHSPTANPDLGVTKKATRGYAM